MNENKPDKLSLEESFHLMWDAFPGFARLIDKNFIILASNPAAIERGFLPGDCCAKFGNPESHRGCLARKTLTEQKAHIDRPTENVLRGWLPVEGHPDVYVHFRMQVPEQNP